MKNIDSLEYLSIFIFHKNVQMCFLQKMIMIYWTTMRSPDMGRRLMVPLLEKIIKKLWIKERKLTRLYDSNENIKLWRLLILTHVLQKTSLIYSCLSFSPSLSLSNLPLFLSLCLSLSLSLTLSVSSSPSLVVKSNFFLSEKTYFTSHVSNMFWATILCKYHEQSITLPLRHLPKPLIFR